MSAAAIGGHGGAPVLIELLAIILGGSAAIGFILGLIAFARAERGERMDAFISDSLGFSAWALVIIALSFTTYFVVSAAFF
jgi:uncharacterized membrane protein SpoIIM required for sporulation